MNSISQRDRVIATRLLRDAQLTELSDATRIATAFEAGFFCLQHGVVLKKQSPAFTIPSRGALLAALGQLQCAPHDQSLGVQLLEWFENRYHLPPIPCSADAAVRWAMRMSKLAGL